MGRFSYEDADKYGGNGGSNYFSLKDDGDTAKVHLLGNDMGDFCGYAVHEVEVNERRRWVNCLRSYKDPIDACPFCKARIQVKARLFIPLYNIDDNEIQIWERGKNFFRTLSSYCARNPKVASLVTEIERQGKKGDTSTTYALYRVEETDKTLDDFKDDMPDIIGTVVLDKTADEMEYFLKKGSFPDSRRATDEEIPTRRRSERDRERDGWTKVPDDDPDLPFGNERRTMSGRRGHGSDEDAY